MKVVISKCGDFGLSDKAVQMLIDTGRFNEDDYFDFKTDEERTDPDLVNVIEILNSRYEDTGKFYSDLQVVEIPDDVEWYIDTLIDSGEDTYEIIREKHRRWGI